MLWPVLLLLASVVMCVLGWVGFCFSWMDPAPRKDFWQAATLVWFLPLGVLGVLASLVWFGVLFVRWLA